MTIILKINKNEISKNFKNQNSNTKQYYKVVNAANLAICGEIDPFKLASSKDLHTTR